MTKTKKLMFEDTANVGDKIRAYDFAPREIRGDCYLEGIVIKKGFISGKDYKCYKIKVTKKVFCGTEKSETKIKTAYVPFETDMDDFEKKYYPEGTARVMKLKDSSIKVEYFVWGVINRDQKSFYIPADKLEKFMSDQKLSNSTKLQIRALKHCQGLSLNKGFTIERRYTFGNGETSKKFKVKKFTTNQVA